MLKISIEPKSSVPLYQQIVDQVKQLVSDEKFGPGEQIPAVREMARLLLVNPSTVARAYYTLKKAGVVATSRRRGTIILGNHDKFPRNYLPKAEFVDLNGEPRRSGSNKRSQNEKLAAILSLHLAHWRVQRYAPETRC